MDSRKIVWTKNNNQNPPSKKSHLEPRFQPEVLYDPGVDLLSDDDDDLEPTDVCNDHDRKMAERFEERKILKPVPVRDIVALNKRKRSTEEGPSKTDMFGSLPDEMIMKILGYLDNRNHLIAFSQTCRRFNFLCKDEAFWFQLNLNDRKLDVDAIGHILVRGVKDLSLSGASLPTPMLSKHLTLKLESFISKVQYLDLSYARIETESLCFLLSKMRHLIKLSLESLGVNVDVIKEVVANQDLDTLDLAMTNHVDLECLNLLTTRLPKLESLNLAWTNLRPSELSYIFCKLPICVKHFDISGQFFCADDDLLTLIKRCVFLESLNISDSMGAVSIGTFREIINNLTGLKTLGISRCYEIPYHILFELNGLEKLEVLSAYQLIPDSCYDEICCAFPKVKINKNPVSDIAKGINMGRAQERMTSSNILSCILTV